MMCIWTRPNTKSSSMLSEAFFAHKNQERKQQQRKHSEQEQGKSALFFERLVYVLEEVPI